jgi:NADH dehydrogenase [ubiquinone] 1 alpha subcomplex assembly factor 7
MGRDVAERIRRRIRETGPITFAEFMDEALYGPGGFYDRMPVGPRGDFVTSPHVHPVFGRLVGTALEEMWSSLGRPTPFRVVELGAGDGTLARELIAGFERAGIEFAYEAVEASAAARASLAAITPIVASTVGELVPLDPGVVLANELLDNLPFRRVRRRDGELVEIRVGFDGDAFVEVESALDPAITAESPSDADAFERIVAASRDADGPFETVVPTGAMAFVGDLGRLLRRGYALLIDYASREAGGGEVHGYRDHRVFDDVLREPGSADITAGVDLDAIARRARAVGMDAFDSVSQAEALAGLGLNEWLHEELEHQGTLLAESRGLEAVRTFGGRGRARMLVDPAGLGRLRWLVIATHGLREPAWLHGTRKHRPSTD